MSIKSTVTGKEYAPQNCCYILNQKQTALYMKNGLELLDVLISSDDKLVYVFDKSKSASYYTKWKNYELE